MIWFSIYFSNLFRLINALLPTYKTNSHLGLFNNSLILFSPIFEYKAASLVFYMLFESKHHQSFNEKTDKQRTSFHKFYSNQEWGQAQNYHLAMGSSS